MIAKRYPGVFPFNREQKNVFYGRDNDIVKFTKLLLMRNHVLLYSKSGVGKTSLLNAGVLPRLENDFKIIKIRFFAYDNKTAQTPTEIIINNLKNIDKADNKTVLDEIIDKTETEKTLWYYLKQLECSNNAKFILVFDQFEELFTYPENQINEFKKQLHELINIDIPPKIKQFIAINDNEKYDIFYDELKIKIVFSIRSDRLNLLNMLTDKLPDIQETFYDLKPLSTQQTALAITKPAENKGSYITENFNYHKHAVESIIKALTNNNTQNIETTQLQIVCQKIENIVYQKQQIDSKNIVQIKEKDLPKFKDIFLSFYEDAITNVSLKKDNNNKHEIRIFIENQLIRNKQRISLDELICLDYINNKTLKNLINTHLLRAERNSTGGFSYELSHDTLIVPIIKCKNK